MMDIETTSYPTDASQAPVRQTRQCHGLTLAERDSCIEAAIDSSRLMAHMGAYREIVVAVDDYPLARFLARHPDGGTCAVCEDQPWAARPRGLSSV